MDQKRNVEQIEGLNQRGGRMLTVVDLMQAGTISEEMAAYLLCAVSAGASFLTAARPGNAGKTTVLANLLSFLPPQARILTIRDAAMLHEVAGYTDDGNTCYLVHEIGHGPFYSYLWNGEVPVFLGMLRQGKTVASCLHADTLEEMEEVLLGRLGVREADFRAVGLLLFIHVLHGVNGLTRRVSHVYEAVPGEGHRLAFSWDPETDTHRQHGPFRLPGCGEAEIGMAREFIRLLVKRNVRMLPDVRQRVVHYLAG